VYPDPRVAHEKVQRLVRRRRLLRRVRIGAKLAGGLAVLGGVVFGGYRGAEVVRTVWGAHHRRPAAVARTARRTTGTTTTTVPGPPPCTSTALAARQSHWQVVGGTLYEIVVLDDTSGAPCTVSGYANLSVAGVNGATLAPSVHDDPSLGAQAGASAAPVVMGSGQPAWLEVSYSVSCTSLLGPGQAPTGTPGQCERGRSLGILLPQTTAALAVPQPLGFSFATSGFDVGPFAPGAPPTSAPVPQ
jgi:Domain of unknown function (DUF4232)